ncbi:pyroglutamyl-peptidase I [Halobacillus sp. BBL2006]|uniref:pyroglutamyl-peptidase I n=1 Tax=Halobacillus sp. BBL2006 TaxID=1543706 RepID=UPI0005443805|nr:pyroglutamyl-peptidase I [Halobacillus sp. BBL2006]KHE72904.1 peptidase C15 [Halobacillus sp. BBL2006]
MRKLLLTGFEPFLNFSINPTQQIVRELDGMELNGLTIIGKVLSVNYEKSGEELLHYIEEVQPDVVLSLGLAAGRHKLTPERIAINCDESKDKDNHGHTPDGEPIMKDGPDGLFSTLPIQAFVERLIDRGYPAEISNTAGTYLCNHVMYQGLYHFREHQRSVPCGFVHMPASHELAVDHSNLPSWSQEDLTNAVKEIIQVL